MNWQGAMAAVVMLAWVIACFAIAVAQAEAETHDQRNRTPPASIMDGTDLLQQAELDRLSRVDKLTDKRLDRHGYILWALVALNGAAAVAQILGVIFR